LFIGACKYSTSYPCDPSPLHNTNGANARICSCSLAHCAARTHWIEAFLVAPVSVSLAPDSHSPAACPRPRQTWEILAASARSLPPLCRMGPRMLSMPQHGRATAHRRHRAGRPPRTTRTLHPIPIFASLIFSRLALKLSPHRMSCLCSSPRPRQHHRLGGCCDAKVPRPATRGRLVVSRC
jgi:hypothetical protein